MTYATYSEFVRSADELPFDIFRARWLLMPECDNIKEFDPDDLDHSTNVLHDLYDEIRRPIGSLRAISGLSQKKFADRFAIPCRTVQNWEARGGCPIYLRSLIRQSLALPSLEELLGVEP